MCYTPSVRETAVRVPATSKASAATVTVREDGSVYKDGTLVGYVSKGAYTYSPKAAGHSGRIARYHTEVAEWVALTVKDAEKPTYEQYPYKGGVFPSHYRKNTRKAALAYLVAVSEGVPQGDARYFYWEKN
jgi:hypothetical protein